MVRFLLSLLPFGAAAFLAPQWRWHVVICGIICSVITFFVYGADKLCALRSWRRVPEKWLLFLGFAGGMPGAIAAMELFRHKTVKSSFKNFITALLVIQILLASAFSAAVYLLDGKNFTSSAVQDLKKHKSVLF
jgi:uncharacterized membrane protein YsdA (DUF1294 family)